MAKLKERNKVKAFSVHNKGKIVNEQGEIWEGPL